MEAQGRIEGLTESTPSRGSPTVQGCSQDAASKTLSLDRPIKKSARTHSHPLLSSGTAFRQRLKGKSADTEVVEDSATSGDILTPLPSSRIEPRVFPFSSSNRTKNVGTTSLEADKEDGSEGRHKMEDKILARNGDGSTSSSLLNAAQSRETRPTESEHKRLSLSSLLSMGSLHGSLHGPGSQASSVAGSFKNSAMEQHANQKELKSPTWTSPHMEASVAPTTATDNVSPLATAHTFPAGAVHRDCPTTKHS